MGYARVFWIREEPIRQHVSACGRDDSLADEVGRGILAFSVKDGFRGQDQEGDALPLFDTPSVFFPFWSFHSTDFCPIVWTGSRLVALPNPTPAMFEALCQLVKMVGTDHVVLPISEAEYHRVIGGGHWHNQIEKGPCASVYWIYEDFTRDFERRPQKDWPCRELGVATLELILSNWSRSQTIRNHGNAISRCCSFRRPEFAVLAWSGNRLRIISETEDEEIQRMRQYLSG